MKHHLLFIFLLLILTTNYRSVQADWPADGQLICQMPNDQTYPRVSSDGAGGAFIVWFDLRSGDYDVYLQRINGYGDIMWHQNGIPVSTAVGDQVQIIMTEDGFGGVIIVWQDNRYGHYDVYAQRVNGDGDCLWTTNGAAVCTAGGDQVMPAVIGDGLGGAVIVWQDGRRTDEDIYAQRISSTGNALWTTNGVPVSTESGDEDWPDLVSDNLCGAMIAWFDSRTGARRCYAQRIDANGNLLWTSGGVDVGAATDPSALRFPRIAADDSGGMYVAWLDPRNGNDDVYAQRLDADGTILWSAGGVAVCTNDRPQKYLQVTPDGYLGLIVAFVDDRNVADDDDLFAQRLDQDGNILWTADGTTVTDAPEDCKLYQIVGDGRGGAIIPWRDWRYSYQSDILAQHINSDGVRLISDIHVCTASLTQAGVWLATDQDGRSDPRLVRSERVF